MNVSRSILKFTDLVSKSLLYKTTKKAGPSNDLFAVYTALI